MPTIDYVSPGPEASRFLADTTSVFAGLRGPFGSGKSVAACMKLGMLATQQVKSPRDGIRKSRIGIIRNTNPQLSTTTIKTWLDWFPEADFGPFRWSPPYTHHWKPAWTGDVDAEFIFLPMDGEDSLAKVLSLELTHVWFNEARELQKSVIDGAMGRLGRYPPKRDGGVEHPMALADTNSPSEEHWWPIMAGDVPAPDWMSDADKLTLIAPDDWTFYAQAGAVFQVRDGDGKVIGYEVNPEAENLPNIGADYYRRMLGGKTSDWIKVYLMNQYGALHSGRAVYEGTYDKDIHEIEDLWPMPAQEIVVGLDFGLTPAATWLVNMGDGAWVAFLEKVFSRGTAADLAKHIKLTLPKLPQCRVSVWGDPGGKAGGQGEGSDAFRVLAGEGIHCDPTPTNSTEMREGAVNSLLTSLIRGKPALRICRRCVNLRNAMQGGYRRGTILHPGDTLATIKPAPIKNQASHIAESLQYAALGTGAYDQLVGITEDQLKTHVSRTHYQRARRGGRSERRSMRR